MAAEKAELPFKINFHSRMVNTKKLLSFDNTSFFTKSKTKWIKRKNWGVLELLYISKTTKIH